MMKKEEVTALIREYLALKKRMDHLQGELRAIRDSFTKTGDLAVLINKEGPLLEQLMGLRSSFEGTEGLLYGYRSKEFIRSVIFCVADLEGEYGKNEHYQNLLSHLISIVRHFEEFDADRKKYGNLIQLPDDKIE